MIGAFAPIARRDGLYSELASLVNEANNRSALEVINFHYSVRTESSIQKTLLNKFMAVDKSFPMAFAWVSG